MLSKINKAKLFGVLILSTGLAGCLGGEAPTGQYQCQMSEQSQGSISKVKFEGNNWDLKENGVWISTKQDLQGAKFNTTEKEDKFQLTVSISVGSNAVNQTLATAYFLDKENDIISLNSAHGGASYVCHK